VDLFVSGGKKWELQTDAAGDNHSNIVDRGFQEMLLKAGGSIHLTRGWRLRGAALWERSVKLHGEGFDIPFDNASGWIAGVSWHALGVSYTKMQYTRAMSAPIDASTIGVTLTFGMP
jgi:hypothetical protein